MKVAWLAFKNLLFLAVVPGFIVFWAPLRWFERRPSWPPVWRWDEWVPAALFLAGLLLLLVAQWTFAKRGEATPFPFDPPKRFIRRGAYKWVRNPMYLGLAIMVGAEGLFLESWHIGVYFICLVCALHLLVVLHEEEALRFRFGAMYEDYRRDVPRWLPRKPKPIPQTVAPFEVRR